MRAIVLRQVTGGRAEFVRLKHDQPLLLRLLAVRVVHPLLNRSHETEDEQRHRRAAHRQQAAARCRQSVFRM